MKIGKKLFRGMSAEAISALKAPVLRQMIRAVRQLFSNQEKTFKKYEENTWSPALDKMQKYYGDKGKKAPSKMNMNQMRSELFHLQDFFKAETSTVPGARKVAIEQDKRIFGEDENGKPKRRMTLQQRTDFWAAYNEFISIEKANYVERMGSDTIQQYLGDMIIQMARKNRKDDDSLPFSYSDFKELKRRLENTEWEKSNYEKGNNRVLSGTRPY